PHPLELQVKLPLEGSFLTPERLVTALHLAVLSHTSQLSPTFGDLPNEVLPTLHGLVVGFGLGLSSQSAEFLSHSNPTFTELVQAVKQLGLDPVEPFGQNPSFLRHHPFPELVLQFQEDAGVEEASSVQDLTSLSQLLFQSLPESIQSPLGSRIDGLTLPLGFGLHLLHHSVDLIDEGLHLPQVD